MTMNVYTYYRNRMALEQARREVRARHFHRRLVRRLSNLSTPLTGAGIGFMVAGVASLLAMDGPHPSVPTLMTLGTVWGFMLGSTFDWARLRGRLVASALRGEPVGAEAASQLARHR